MDAKQLTLEIDRLNYRDDIPKPSIEIAKENNLVIVYGYSDDLLEFEGAIDDEVGMYKGGKVYLTKKGKIKKKQKDRKNYIEAIWCPKGPNLDNASWLIKSNIPNSEWRIMEDGEIYCVGIVFSMDDLK